MKRLLIISIISLFSLDLYSQVLESRNQPVFQEGEVLNYKFKYGFITAAEATLRVEPTNIKFDNRPVFHLIADGRTAGTFNVFYKVRNRYDSYIDKSHLLPYLYTENISEATYRRTDKARFYQDKKIVVAKKGTFQGKGQTFDIVSAYYFARSLDISNIKKGETFTMDYFLKDGITPMVIQYVGKERVKTPMGSFNCLKFSPSIQPGHVFRKDSKLYLWITDDANRIPVKAQVEILVGSVTMELTNAKGLKSPLLAANR